MGHAQRIKWTEEKIISSIKDVMKSLDIQRMPTRTEVERATGKSIERLTADLLANKGFDVQQMPQNFPYDLLINSRVKIDVKASRLYTGKTGNFYSFNLEKPFCTCDIYICCLLNDTFEPFQYLIIPSKFIPTNTQISVGENNSKYYKYAGKWEYIQNYDNFMKNVI